MPTVHVDMPKGRTVEEKRALVLAIADAVSETLQRPRKIVRVMLNEYELENFSVDGYSYQYRVDEMNEKYTVENSDIIVNICITEGRTAAQKNQLISNITDSINAKVGFKKENTRVFISDLKNDNFGLNGSSSTTKQVLEQQGK